MPNFVTMFFAFSELRENCRSGGHGDLGLKDFPAWNLVSLAEMAGTFFSCATGSESLAVPQD